MKIAYVGIDLLYPALVALQQCDCEIQRIFTCKTDNKTEFNHKVIAFAKKNAIPYTLEKMMPVDVENLIAEGCKVVICGGYYHRIPTDARLPMVNIHPSLLPTGRGGWPMPIILKRKFSRSGVTLHKISEQIDEGDILLQEAFELEETDHLKTYMEKVGNCLPSMMKKLTKCFEELYCNAYPQGEGEYWSLPIEEDYTVRFDMTRKEADEILRSFYGYEILYIGRDRNFELIDAVSSKERQEDDFFYFPLKDGYVKTKKVEERTKSWN